MGMFMPPGIWVVCLTIGLAVEVTVEFVLLVIGPGIASVVSEQFVEVIG